MSIANPWLPGLYVVDETEDGDEVILSGPWFTSAEAETERSTWGGDTVGVVGWLRDEKFELQEVWYEGPNYL